MPLWRITPAARPDDPRWQDHPRWARVHVRAPTAALARVVAAEMERDPTQPPSGNESLSFHSGLEDEKLYWVARLDRSEAAAVGSEEGPTAILAAEPLAGAKPAALDKLKTLRRKETIAMTATSDPAARTPATADFQRMLVSPSTVFDAPRAVLDHPALTQAQKLEILRRWEIDARELAVAEEEAMMGGEPNRLDEVLQAIDALTGGEPETAAAPTKHGGHL